MLRANEDLCNDRDNLRMTPLHWAAIRGDITVATILLDYGADANLIDHLGRIPRVLADEKGHPDMVEVSYSL